MTRTKSLLPIDELNTYKTYLESQFNGSKVSRDKVIDEILELMIMSYVLGVETVNFDLDEEKEADADDMEKAIDEIIDGMTWRERVEEYINQYNQMVNDKVVNGLTDSLNAKKAYEAIVKVIDTETHRVYTEAQMDTASSLGAQIKKTWRTMLDDRVRANHEYLEGVTIGVNEYFATPDGDKALYPGGFEEADNNIFCRCELSFSKG